MKLLITLIITTLALIGCSSSGDEEQIRQLKSTVSDLKERLYTCDSQLDFYRSSNSGSTQEEVSSEPEQTEPQYETVDAYQIKTKVGDTTCYEREETACGLTFSECKDDYVYRCMVDVKYKIIEEKRLIE